MHNMLIEKQQKHASVVAVDLSRDKGDQYLAVKFTHYKKSYRCYAE